MLHHTKTDWNYCYWYFIAIAIRSYCYYKHFTKQLEEAIIAIAIIIIYFFMQITPYKASEATVV